MFFKYVIIIPLVLQIINAVDPCRTPNSQNGDCKPINECQPLYALLLTSPTAPSTRDFLRKSQCGWVGRYPKVCCPLESSTPPTSKPPEENFIRDITSNLLPSDNACGSGIQQYIIGGQKTDLDEFPWMALLEYERPDGGRRFLCGGVLISKRYVLTAGHCVAQGNLVSVRLGEYDTESEIDCVSNGFGRDCAPPPLDVAVEEKIVHEKYNLRNKLRRFNDIALLRLKQDVKFSDYIRPICLPTTVEELSKSYEGQRLVVAGWGRTENASASNIKLKIQIPVRSLPQCNVTYVSRTGVVLAETQLCAGGEEDTSTCSGDSGGPLMTLSRDKNGDSRWYATGLVSFGPTSCGTKDFPSVYTRVSTYMEWIVSKLRP